MRDNARYRKKIAKLFISDTFWEMGIKQKILIKVPRFWSHTKDVSLRHKIIHAWLIPSQNGKKFWEKIAPKIAIFKGKATTL